MISLSLTAQILKITLARLRALDVYKRQLQNQKFKKIYIDAFAGTGEIETSDGGQSLVGSAKRALDVYKRQHVLITF